MEAGTCTSNIIGLLPSPLQTQAYIYKFFFLYFYSFVRKHNHRKNHYY